MKDPTSRAPEFSRAGSAYVLGLLFVVYVFNFIDRQVLAILLEDIKADLGVSDTAMGFLSGPAFALFYTLAGIPIARWADRGSRRTIIAMGLAIWSAMTAACGLARGFGELALARVGVGIGEAAGSPPAHSMISDLFPPERRATALSIYAQGIYIGAMIAFLLGGYLKDQFDWRTAFLVVGTPGLVLAILVRTTVREPTRGYWEARQSEAAGAAFGDVVRFLFRKRSFVYLVLAACCQSLSGYAFLSWAPTLLSRVHQMSGVEIGTWLGLVIGVGGSLGALLGGAIGDRLGARDARWYVYLSAIVSIVGVPFAAAFLLLEDRTAALLSFIPFYVFGAMYVGPLWSLGQGLAMPAMRATASAILLLILNIVGLGLGPFLIGLLNDGLFASYGVEAIRYSLLVVAVVGGFGGVFFLLCARTLRSDLEEVRG